MPGPPTLWRRSPSSKPVGPSGGAAAVERIRTGGYGVDADGLLVGPGGFQVDLGSCPDDWSDSAGVGETIRVAYTTARSGNLAPYGYVADGMLAYFEYVNANGGIDGRPIELVIQDDEYKADRTVELVDEMLTAGDIFSITTLGYPGTVAVIDTLNEACVPHPYAVTSHPIWGDPIGRPWTTGLQLSHSTESRPVGGAGSSRTWWPTCRSRWGPWSGTTPSASPTRAVSGPGPTPTPMWCPNSLRCRTAPHRGGTVANELATIRASDPDVFISMTAGSFCLQAVQEAGRVELTESATALFTPSVCRDPAAYLIPAGDAADGWNIVGGGIKATTDPRFADEPFIVFTDETLASAGFDPAVGFYGTGFATYGWAFVEALRIAAELDGGLTRSNLILAQRTMDLDHPVLLDGVRFAMDGAADGYPVEGSNFGVYDAANQVWVEDTPVVDVDGSTPNCSWTDAGC